MTHENFNFEKACKLANIKVSNSQDGLTIRTFFNPLNKANIGSLIILIMAFAIGILAITHSKDLFSMIVGSILGFGIGTVGILVITSQLTDYFKITGGILEIRNGLKFKRELITTDYKVKMKTRSEFIQLKSQPGSGSYVRIVELYISNGKKDLLLLDFQTDEKEAAIANHLGGQISSLVKNKIKSL